MNLSDLAPVLYGLASAASFGAGDFCGAMATKRTSVYRVLIASQLVGVVLLILLALAFREQIPPLEHLLWGGLGGIFGALGLLTLYRALATGRMGVAAPVSAVISAALPVIFGMFIQGLPTNLQFLGFGLALVAVVFVSASGDVRASRRELLLPVASGIGFGLFFIFINRASQISIFWPLVIARFSSLGLNLAYTTYTGQPKLPETTHLYWIVLAGILDAGGNALYALAGQVGRLDVVSVVSSLYPAATVLLAWIILKERLSLMQSVGVVVALVAIMLIAS
jgi:drug/metabolite transporter (DMT)-like permease